MSWGRIDDGLHDHEKVVALGPVTDPMGLWTLCFSWTHRPANARTPGFVPRMLPARFAGSTARGTRLARRLVDVGLWEVADGGWVFHDWAEYAAPERRPRQDADIDPESLSAKRAAAGRRGGQASGETRRQAAGSKQTAKQVASPDEANTKPVASTPKPSPEPEEPKPLKQVASPASRSVPRGEARGDEANRPMVLEDQQPQGRGRASLPPATPTGNALLAEHLATYPHTLPRDEQAWASRAIEKHLAEGIAQEFVRQGLVLLREAQAVNPDIGMGLLGKFIRQAMNPPARRGGSQVAARPQSREERQADAFVQVRAKLAAESSDHGSQAEFFPFAVDGRVTERRDTA